MDIHEFARIIGVSPTTVSHALSGRGYVSLKTKTMVIERMSELGYVPNGHAQQLATGRSRFVTLHTDSTRDLLDDMYSSYFVHCVQVGLKARGYFLMLDTPPDAAQEAELFRQMVLSKVFAGTILLETGRISDEMLQQLASPKHPMVRVAYHNPREPLPSLSSVFVDVDAGLRQLAEFLVGLGHTRIGIINYEFETYIQEYFVSTLRAMGINVPPRYIVRTTTGLAEGGPAFRALMEQEDPPTAVFIRKDEIAFGALREARRMGLRVPQDISIVGYDNVPMAEFVEPALTTIDSQLFAVAGSAVQQLFAMFDHPGEVQEPLRCAMALIVRDSVSAPRHR